MNNSNKKARSIAKSLKFWFISLFHNINEDLENKQYEKVADDAIFIAKSVMEMENLVSR
jgi:hypothetical protein